MNHIYKPVSPIGPSHGNSQSPTTQSTPAPPQVFSNAAQVNQLQGQVAALEARVGALEAVVRH